MKAILEAKVARKKNGDMESATRVDAIASDIMVATALVLKAVVVQLEEDCPNTSAEKLLEGITKFARRMLEEAKHD